MANNHEVATFLWGIADEILRDDFKRGKYPDVILPFVVLRRLDCVLAPTKARVLKRHAELGSKGVEKVDGQLRRASGYAFYNLSPFDFQRLLDDPKNIAKNLRAYINGFSENIREILDKFKLRNTIDALEENDLLFMLVQKFADPKVDLHPDHLGNHDMGYVFEELLRRFNEQSNENPGEHFTPREVIRLMVKLVFNGDKDILKQQSVIRTIYDPACGTGGMLSIAKEYVLDQINPNADVRLFGQEVNPETFAIARSDMLMKGDDRDAENIACGSTLSADGHVGSTFDYQLSNPPYGKDWNKDAEAIERERICATGGRFAAGLPRKSDGQMLFLLHMMSKMRPLADGGGRMAIVLNGSPLFTGDAGGGESEIRRHILENDLLETIVALPNQLFYNTGIHTYIWVVTNRKPKKRRGKVLLINGAATVKENGTETEVFAKKMRKSLGDKRNELSEVHVQTLADLASQFAEGPHAKIFDTKDFGYRKITVERPLRLNFQVSPDRIEAMKAISQFLALTASKKRDAAGKKEDEKVGRALQAAILAALEGMDGAVLYRNRDKFLAVFDAALKKTEFKLPAPLKKGILAALSERDETADICTDKDGNPEPDPELRDTESVPLKESIRDYFDREVRPHVPDAWINEDIRDEKDGEVGRVGYEINFNRYFYVYEPPRPLQVIDAEIRQLEAEIAEMLREMTA